MKKVYTLALLMAVCLWWGCELQQSHHTTNMSIVFDRTDSIRSYPTTQILLSPFDLMHDKFQGIHLVFTTISDKDLNGRTVIDLKPQNELTSNIVERDADIKRFTIQVQRALDSFRDASTCGHSIVFRTIAREANSLAALKADNKYLVVYSDLYEANDSVNFYHQNIQQQIRQHPDRIAAQLERSLPLQRTAGVALWLLYEPKSFADNNAFMQVATMYKHLFEAHGAQVHIATQFGLP